MPDMSIGIESLEGYLAISVSVRFMFKARDNIV